MSQEQMDRKSALQWVYSATAGWVSHQPRCGCEPTRQLSPGAALMLVLLLSLGLWVMIWAALSLLASYRLG